MKINTINDYSRYIEIIDKYKKKGCYSNDYIYKDAVDLVSQGLLYEYCGIDNAFLFVKKDLCMRLYYYINDLEEYYSFSDLEDLVVEILFRGNNGTPDTELEYLRACGFDYHIRRDLYSASYCELDIPKFISGVSVQKAKTKEDVILARLLFNSSFDPYSGDYLSEQLEEVLFDQGDILIARDHQGNFAGALHQTIDRQVSWVSHVAVIEEYRGRGIGIALLDTFVENNKKNDKTKYMLWVQANNGPAITMYKNKGFKYLNKSTISMIKLKL